MDKNVLLSQFGLDAQSFVLKDGSALYVEAVVRVLPNKRLVFKARWNDQPVFVKFFIGDDAVRHAKRDAAGAQSLSNANVATPALLYQDVDQKPCCLVYQAIENSVSLEDALYQTNKTEQLALATNLVGVVAQHHNAGLLQTDMHLNNFLLQENTVYTLDGDGLKQSAALTEAQATENLCILLSKFDVLDVAEWHATLVSEYQKARTAPIDLDMFAVQEQVNQCRRDITKQYADKKVFRQCTNVDVVKRPDMFSAVASAFSELNGLDVESLDTLVEKQQRLKSGNTCTVVLSEINQIAVVIKRYNIKHLMHRVNRMFRPTRASVSWANAHRLKLLGLPTPSPIALIEKRQLSLLRGKAYFLSEYLDTPDAAQFFGAVQDDTSQQSAVKALVELFYRLHLLDISHGDMKATNIKMDNGKPVLIDLDSMQHHGNKKAAFKAHVRDINRFMKNWQSMPTLHASFVKAFNQIYTDNSPLQAAQILETTP